MLLVRPAFKPCTLSASALCSPPAFPAELLAAKAQHRVFSPHVAAAFSQIRPHLNRRIGFDAQLL
jgi:hypothetical protein